MHSLMWAVLTRWWRRQKPSSNAGMKECMYMNTFGLNIVSVIKILSRQRNKYHASCKGRTDFHSVPPCGYDGCHLPGEMRFKPADSEEWKTAIVGNGFAQIINNHVTVLVDSCEYPENIDLKRAQDALDRAEEQLRQQQSLQNTMYQGILGRAMAV
ncbi:MAG: FoF1 ATP synthase subunit delta/epsilon [Blautia marasmi]